MAESLGMDRVVIPPSPGLFSSFGLLQADIEQYHSRTLNRLLRDIDAEDLTSAWDGIAEEARAELRREGFADDRISIARIADLHYKGQIYDLSVPAPDGDFDAAKMAILEEAFGEEHLRTYGHRAGPEEPVELVNLRVIARAEPDGERTANAVAPQTKGSGENRRAYFGKAGWHDTPILGRGDLAAETAGPAIIEEYDATCVIPPGWSGRLDARGSVILVRR
jgi:N-methylhydantoinase A